MISSSESKLNRQWLRQASSYMVVAIASVALTLMTLRLFPKFMQAALLSGQTASSVQLNPDPSQTVISNHNFVAVAAKQVGPAVVRLDTERTVAINIPPFFNDPFFRRFFGDDLFSQLPREYRQYGQGSGFIIDSDGIILTNAHVVRGADTVTVTLPDGRTFSGVVKGTDEPSDLAVIKIEGNNLPVAPLGDSDQLQVGDWAIAVGNPLGLDNTITFGIISTLNRSSSQIGIPDRCRD